MLNNNPMISNTYTYNRRFEQFEVTCKGGIARHHEVFINYGSYGTTDTLLAYGYVDMNSKESTETELFVSLTELIDIYSKWSEKNKSGLIFIKTVLILN